MSPAGGIWATAALRLVRKNLVHTTKMATKLLRSKLDAATNAAQLNITTRLQTVAVRRQPVHPAALLRQQKRGVHSTSAKWLSSATGFVRRHLSTSGQAVVRPRIDRSRLPVSNTSRAVAQLTGRAPFASTLRPNLTGGAIPRTAGGYTTTAGRGARYFSHAPACQAQVVQNVSQAMRAFWLSGQRARFDGVGPKGQKRYRAVTAAEEEARVKIECVRDRFAPGSVVDFRVSPTITALSALGSGAAVAVAAAPSLNAEGFLEVLSVDFARALKDLAAVMTDLKKLSSLGDLPISLEKGSVLRVRFPGVDAETVERLCDDMGVQRGVVREDADFLSSAGAAVALRFPFAPDAEGTITSPGGSLRSHGSEGSDELELGDAYFVEESVDNPWLESIADEDGYESMSPPIPYSSSGEHCSEEFEGLEGIYRFMEECDRARGQFQGRR